MKPDRLAFLLTLLVLSACARPTPEQRLVNEAADALGGRSRVSAVKTIVLEGAGTNWNLGQDMTPDATSQIFTVDPYRRAIDFAGGRARVEQTRTPNFSYFQGPQPQKQVLGIDGEIGYNVAANGNATRVSNAIARDRRADLYHHAIGIVRAALDPGAALTNLRTFEHETSLSVTTPNGFSFTLAVDSATKLPTRVVSMTANPNLGDVAIETRFGDYQDVGGLKLPAHLTVTTDKYRTAEIRVATATVDGDVGELAAPAAAASAAPVTGPPPAKVDVQELAKGIWLLAGQSHHSVLVEFADHLKLIEAPQSEARTLAVIAKARELRPGKPLTHVVSTHHHFDHSAGIRAAVSEGLTVVAQKASAAFFQDAAVRAHTIAPDALAKSPKPIKIETVDEELVIKDAAMTVQLYRIAGSPHADTLLMAYFPRQRLLVEVDVYSPGSAVQPYAANLVENITKRGLKVDRIVPLHGRIGTYADLLNEVPRP